MAGDVWQSVGTDRLNTVQHDVFINPGRLTRSTQPFVTVLQADIAEGPQRLACPLFAHKPLPPSKTILTVEPGGVRYLLPIAQMASVPSRVLRRPVASIAAPRDDIIRALDWLFTGV